jgi:hypothetical protein
MMRSGHNAITHWFSEHYRAAGRSVAVVGPMSAEMYPQMKPEAEVTFVLWPEHRPQQLPSDVRGSEDLIAIVRDPYNFWASRMELVRRLGGVPVPEDRLADMYDIEIDIWKAQHAWSTEHPQRTIIYNRWFREAAYRRGLIESHGLTFTDADASRVSTSGGGSSFDGMAFDGRAEKMAVNERWRRYENDPQWRRVVGQVRLSDADRAAFALDGVPELPRTEPLAAQRSNRRPPVDEATIEGFAPATERQGCCDPPLAFT